MHSREKKALALNLLLSLLMAAGYMLLFAYNNTPLGAAIGSDQRHVPDDGHGAGQRLGARMSMCLTTKAPCSLRFRGCRSGSAAAITTAVFCRRSSRCSPA